MKRYAEGTRVGYDKSRLQIGKLLEGWGATGIQWTDEWKPIARFTCRFMWKIDVNEEKRDLIAKFVLVADQDVLKKRSIDGRSGKISEAKYQKNRSLWVSETHRLLLLYLKAALNAIESGLVAAEEVFMPFVEHKESGMTIGKLFASKIQYLPESNAIAYFEPRLK